MAIKSLKIADQFLLNLNFLSKLFLNYSYNNNNETHKILWDFEIERDHLISAR